MISLSLYKIKIITDGLFTAQIRVFSLAKDKILYCPKFKANLKKL